MVDDGTGQDPYLAPPSGRSGWVIPEPVALSPAPGYAYVGFWRRFCAFIIDGIIIAIPTYAIMIPVLLGPMSAAMSQVFNGPNSFMRDPATGRLIPNPQAFATFSSTFEGVFRWVLLAGVLIFVLQVLYHAIFWSRRGGTPGQLLLGIQVRSEVDGSRISFGRACLRCLGYLVSAWVLYIGFIWVAFDARKQGWHDKIAGTVVIRRVG
jgi:uncharacterized RDD family membrane protein YckC